MLLATWQVVSQVVRGTASSKAELYFGHDDDPGEIITDVLTAFSSALAPASSAASCQQWSAMYRQRLATLGGTDGGEKLLQRYEFLERAFDYTLLVLFLQLKWEVCHTTPSLTPLVPPCELGTLLAPLDRAVLHSLVPSDHRAGWQLLFSSSSDGASFAALRRAVQGRPSIMLVIEDTNGHVFGGYAADAWGPHPGFYGSEACFLFSVLPEANIYAPSGRMCFLVWRGATAMSRY